MNMRLPRSSAQNNPQNGVCLLQQLSKLLLFIHTSKAMVVVVRPRTASQHLAPGLSSTCVLSKSVVPPRQTHQIRRAQWRGCLHFGVAIFDFNNSTDCDHDAISSPPDDWPGPVDDDNAVLPTGSGWLCAGSILICRWFNWCGIIYGVFALARGRSNL